jgi:type IV secretory pathway TraG/TraD family ATPase VirD4
MSDTQKILALLGKNAVAQAISQDQEQPKPTIYFGKIFSFQNNTWLNDWASVPVEKEARHTLMLGAPGTGKSLAIRGVLKHIRLHDQPAMIMDHSGEFLQKFYDPARDKIFNPFDKRSVGWSPFNEIKRVYDFERVAKAIVPDLTGSSSNSDWQQQAQVLLANVMRKLWDAGPQCRKNEALLYMLLTAPIQGGDQTTLQGLLKGTSSARLFEESGSKGLAITLGVISRYLTPLTFLKEGDFSISEWVKNPGNSWLFMSYSDSSYQAIKGLFSILASSAIQSALELSEDRDRRIWFVFDELASLGKIDSLDDAMTKLRKRGGCVIAGIQSTAQLEETWGEKGAQILLACFGNVLMLRVSDEKTAEKCSALIGDVERWETSTGTSHSLSEGGSGGGRSGSFTEGGSSNTSKQIRRLVLPSEFFGLSDRHGYARIAGSATIYKVYLENLFEHPTIAPADDPCDDVVLS